MVETAEQLVSVRGLVDSDFENPLRKFTGTFAGYSTAKAQGYEGTRVEFQYKDIDNVTVAKGFVYNFPTAVINVGLSNKHKSRYGYLADSIAALIADDEDLKDQVNRRMTLVYCDGQDGRPEPKPIWNKDADISEFPDKMVPTPVWNVVEIEGSIASAQPGGDSTTADYAEANLVGEYPGSSPKTRAQFNKWAFADARVRKDVALQRSISDKSFINALLQLGKVAEDENGVFKKP